MDKRIIVITGESAWLVSTNEEGTSGYVHARASFGYHMPNEHRYEGAILTGDDGLNLREGTRLVFRCQCGESHTPGWNGDGIVTSGVITRVVNHADAPDAIERVKEGEDADGNPVTYITLNPSWKWLLPHVPTKVREDFDRALGLADLLVALADLGRITQADLQAAEARLRASTL
jgi:hypothetical protein